MQLLIAALRCDPTRVTWDILFVKPLASMFLLVINLLHVGILYYCSMGLLLQIGEIDWDNLRTLVQFVAFIHYRPGWFLCQNNGKVYLAPVDENSNRVPKQRYCWWQRSVNISKTRGRFGPLDSLSKDTVSPSPWSVHEIWKCTSSTSTSEDRYYVHNRQVLL